MDEIEDKKILKVGITLGLKLTGALLTLVLILCCINMIKPGEVGVIVNLLGAGKGVQSKELTVGIHFTAPWQKVYKFPIFEQNHQWTNKDAFTFQTAEGLTVTADLGITFHLEPSRIHELFSRYRRGMDEITHLFIKNIIRDAINKVASRMKIEELYGPQKEEFFTQVHEYVRKELHPIGFSISHIFIIGKFGVPELVMEALNKKIEATQRAQQRENELREAEAQAKKEVALAEGAARSKLISAKAQADSNALLSNSLTPNVIKWQALQKWDGKLPTVLGKEDLILNLQNMQ